MSQSRDDLLAIVCAGMAAPNRCAVPAAAYVQWCAQALIAIEELTATPETAPRSTISVMTKEQLAEIRSKKP